MKKKLLFSIFVIAALIANIYLTPNVASSKKSDQITLGIMQAVADENNEAPDPITEPVPFSAFPSEWSLSALIDYFF